MPISTYLASYKSLFVGRFDDYAINCPPDATDVLASLSLTPICMIISPGYLPTEPT
jgi:hypothetical protein